MQNSNKTILKLIGLVVGLSIVSGCTDVTMRPGLPDYMTNLAIPTFQNRIAQPDLENELTQQVTQEFLVDGRMSLVDPDQASAVLQGTIVQYLLEPLLLDVHNTPQQYKLRIIIQLVLKDNKAGKDVWTEDSFEESTTYYVANSLGISPETEQSARKRLVDQLATRILKRVIEGF